MKRRFLQENDNLCDYAAMYTFDGLSDAMREAFEVHLGQCSECRQFVVDVVSITENRLLADSQEPSAGMKSWMRARFLREDLTEQDMEQSPRIIGGIIVICMLLILATAILAFRMNELSAAGSSPATAYNINRVIDLKAANKGITAEGHAVIILDAVGIHLIVNAEKLPKPGKDEAYRVWLMMDGTSVDAGTFPTNDGAGTLQYVGDAERYERISISLEPDLVGDRPAGQIILTGNLS